MVNEPPPVISYETWALNATTAKTLTHLKMEQTMLDITLCKKKSNTWIRKQEDIIETNQEDET